MFTGEPVKNGLARMVLGPWLFAILIITASFTASLSSMMTISRSQPWFLDIETLKLKNATVGCNKNSVMVRFLTQVLLIPQEKIKQIPSVDMFPDALEKGEIQAAFFSGAHAKVFLAKHCKQYTKATIFKLVGMGFVCTRLIIYLSLNLYSNLGKVYMKKRKKEKKKSELM